MTTAKIPGSPTAETGGWAGDIAARFHHAWPTISRHLKVLEEAGLVTAERRGRERLYRVDHGKLELLREWLGWFDAKKK